VESGAFGTPNQKPFFNLLSDEQKIKNSQAVTAATEKFFEEIISLPAYLYSLKKNAFKEEREWRLISLLCQSNDETCDFRADVEKIIPYRKVKLLELDSKPINKIILGPKNQAPINVVEDCLRMNNIAGVEVIRSEASYR
jgi:hypothetical protein